MFPALQWSLARQPLVQLGGADERVGYSLSGVQAARVVGDRLLVVDAGAREVRAYSLRGELVNTSGGEGGGPGEYRVIRGAAAVGDTALAVWDLHLQRLTIVDRAGSAVSIVTPNLVAAGSRIARFVGVLSNGHIVFLNPGDALSVQQVKTGNIRDSMHFAILGPDGSYSGSEVVLPGTELVIERDHRSQVATAILFGRAGFGVVTAGALVIGTSDSLSLSAVRPDGQVIHTVSLNVPLELVTPELLRAERNRAIRDAERQVERMQQDPVRVPTAFTSKDTERRRIEGLPHRQTVPAFVRLFGGSGGHTWVGRYAAPDDSLRQWLVFDSTLQPVAQINIPTDLEIMDHHNEMLVVRTKDHYDRETISVYGILKGGRPVNP